MSVETPDWVRHAVFYQIFPDRFARSRDRAPIPGIRLKEWGAPPEEQGFQGGDLDGIVEHLDYLIDLGVTALYLNPVFSSASNHRYHTYDYYEVDPLLGGNDALRRLLDAAHANGLRVVLDGVFNHASRGFWPFHHVLENGSDSPYVDWFFLHDWPLQPYPPDEHTPINYSAWWGLPALPKINVANPGARAYLLGVAEHWVRFGADGWRLDVPEEIDDPAFWQEFRCIVKDANPDAYLVGEIWHAAPDWLDGDRFDAVMNYAFSRAALGFFGRRTLNMEYRPGGYALNRLQAEEFSAVIEQMYAMYDWEVALSQLNLLDSHDTARVLWTVGEDVSALRLCVLCQMTMPGAPCIYYGDEIGLTGATDPYSRGAMPWHEPERWNEDLLDFYRRATKLRHAYPVLRTGTIQSVYAQGDVYVCLREEQGQWALVAFNTGESAATVTVEGLDPALEGRQVSGVWNSGAYVVEQGRISDMHLPPRDALVLVSHD